MGFAPVGPIDALINLILAGFIVYGMYSQNMYTIVGCGLLLIYNTIPRVTKSE